MKSENEKACHGACLRASEVGVSVAGNPIAYVHPDCELHNPRTYTRAEVEALMCKAWNLGHLNASASDEAYPPKVQRPIDIDFVFRVGP